MRYWFSLFLITLLAYTLTNHGGIRAPDSEVVFRVTESIIDSGSFSPKDLEAWPGFGVSQGTDKKWYSVYPPMESIILIPAVWIARAINEIGWYNSTEPPVSHFVGSSLYHVLFSKPLLDRESHTIRFIVSLADVVISALAVIVFYGIVLLISESKAGSFLLSVVYAFGSFAWSYAGSFFSEPLATLFALISFYLLIKTDPAFQRLRSSGKATPMLSGISLGLAVATHYTALLFAPLWLFYLIWMTVKNKKHDKKYDKSELVSWLIGFGFILLLLGIYNYIRFGDFFQSGRELSAYNRAEFVSLFSGSFWSNFYGLTIGTGKGLLIFCPVAVLAVVTWRSFQAKHPFLFYWMIILIVVRILFVAHYKDWHGGYSLGPRYLFMVIPFMLIPAVFWLREAIDKRKWKTLMSAGLITYGCVIQQLYFVLGEIFSYYHSLNFLNRSKGIDIFLNDRAYISWNMSPAVNLHNYYRGPWIFQSLDISNIALWISGSLFVLFLFIVIGVRLKKSGVIFRDEKNAN